MRTSGEGSVEERRQRPTRLAATFRTFRKRGISRAFSFFFFFHAARMQIGPTRRACVFLCKIPRVGRM